MGELILLILAIYWLVTDTSTALWVIAALVSGEKGSRGKPAEKPRIRIDRPHYYDEDEHECSVCGSRFRGKGMTCPRCGVRFTGTKEDDEEFIEEMLFWEDD